MAESISYTYKHHLVDEQHEAELALLHELDEGSYTMEKPLIKYNLYKVNALSAVIAFETEEPTAVCVRVVGKTKQADFYQSFPRATRHILPIVGLYSDYENTIEIYPYQKYEHKTVHTIKTPKTKGAELVTSMDAKPEMLEDNVIFMCPATWDLAIAVDYAGDVRLDFTVPMLWDVKRLPNGHLLMSSDRLYAMPYYVTGLYEFSAVGKIYKEYRVPRGNHHDEAILPNGDIVALNDNVFDGTYEDQAVVLDGKTGATKRVIDFKKFVEPGLHKSGSWSDDDWFHCNTVYYDENSNSLTFSGRHVNAMFNIDFDTEKLNWIISDPEGWPEEYQKYLFTPKGDGDFEWQYEQHSSLITPLGDVMCFDNHHYGAMDPADYLAAPDSYSRGVKYRIDTDNMTIEQLWQYGKERGAEFFSPYISNVVYYNEGHYLVHSGGIAYDHNGVASEELGSRLYQTDPDGTLNTITIEQNDGKKLWELRTSANYYRAEKLTLYDKEHHADLELGKGVVLGSLDTTPTMDYDIPAEKTGELLPPSCEGDVVDEDDMFTFFAKFEKGQLVMLILDNGEEKRRYFISTSHGGRGAMCSGTFLTTDDRDTRTIVTKEGLSGDYKMTVIIDDTEYETGVTIHA